MRDTTDRLKAFWGFPEGFAVLELALCRTLASLLSSLFVVEGGGCFCRIAGRSPRAARGVNGAPLMDVFSSMIWKRAIEAARAAKEELPQDALKERYGAQCVVVALVEAADATIEHE